MGREADSIYGDFVVPNPYGPRPLCPRQEYAAYVDTLFEAHFSPPPIYLPLLPPTSEVAGKPPRLQCQTHLGRFNSRRILSGVRVIRLPLEIGVRDEHFCPTLFAPPAGGTGKLTVISPPGARCSLGDRIRLMFGRPIRPTRKHNAFTLPTPWSFSIAGSVPPHTSALWCSNSRVAIFNRANSCASLANFCRASLTFPTYPHPPSRSNFLVFYLTVTTGASWDRCASILSVRGETRPSLNFMLKNSGGAF